MPVDRGGGYATHFVVGSEVTTIRMSNNTLQDARAAARTLEARFFIKQMGRDAETGQVIWGVWDVTKPLITIGKVQNDPRKTFVSDTMDAAVMYAMTMGSIE